MLPLSSIHTYDFNWIQIEKLLPVIDQLELLPLAEKNRGLILSALPLIVDTAFLVLPLAVSFIKTGSGTFSSLGLGLIALGGYEGNLYFMSFIIVPS